MASEFKIQSCFNSKSVKSDDKQFFDRITIVALRSKAQSSGSKSDGLFVKFSFSCEVNCIHKSWLPETLYPAILPDAQSW